MKILQVINSLGTGGAEKLLLDTIPLYREKGIEMDVLLLWDNDCMFTQQLRALNCCTIHILKKSSNIKVIYNPFSIFKIVQIIRQYDIVHVHLFPAQYLVVLAKLVSFSKVKLIFTEHSTSNRRIQHKIFGLAEGFFYRKYAKIICITDEIVGILNNHVAMPRDKFEVIPNGSNLETIRKANPISKKAFFPLAGDDIKIVIQVSSFQEPKNQATLIRAIKALPLNIKLILVGEGVLKTNCEALVQELNLQERVLFLGIRMDVPQLLKSADVIVLSSKYEGLSLSSIEGMASGKAFLASDVPGLRKVVNGAGVLFEEGNVEELVNKISRLINDPTLYDAVVKSCLERASEYDINKMINKHVKIYQNL